MHACSPAPCSLAGQVSEDARIQPEETAGTLRPHHWFPCEMTSEKRAQKFHTDDASRVLCMEFRARFSDVIWREKTVLASRNVDCFLWLRLQILW